MWQGRCGGWGDEPLPLAPLLQARLQHPHPPSEPRRGPGRPRKSTSTAIEDWSPAPAADGDGNGCRACGRSDELETELHLTPAGYMAVTLIICDSCESEYHMSCLQASGRGETRRRRGDVSQATTPLFSAACVLCAASSHVLTRGRLGLSRVHHCWPPLCESLAGGGRQLRAHGWRAEPYGGAQGRRRQGWGARPRGRRPWLSWRRSGRRRCVWRRARAGRASQRASQQLRWHARGRRWGRLYRFAGCSPRRWNRPVRPCASRARYSQRRAERAIHVRSARRGVRDGWDAEL